MRGWSWAAEKLKLLWEVFPAHAGVILASLSIRTKHISFSRTCGGDPSSHIFLIACLSVFPAHAGVIPILFELTVGCWCFSRTCRGDPRLDEFPSALEKFFPHMRGWSRCTLFFKLACMCFSRTCGGDPMTVLREWLLLRFFPHMRGWSYSKFKGWWPCFVFPAHAGVILFDGYEKYHALVFPAHAGVILKIKVKVITCHSFSRTRGGDPRISDATLVPARFFPHTQGWS